MYIAWSFCNAKQAKTSSVEKRWVWFYENSNTHTSANDRRVKADKSPPRRTMRTHLHSLVKKVKKKETKNMWDRPAHSITICLDSASHNRSRGLPNFIDTSPFEPSSKSFNELFAHTTMKSLASSNYINNTIHIHSTNHLKPTQLEMLSLILLLHHLMFLVVYCVDETMMRLNCLYR